MRIITVIICWGEGKQEEATEITLHDGGPRILLPSQKSQEQLQGNKKGIQAARVDKSGKQLLPTDRIVLDALRGRVPRGEQTTIPVRNAELAAECEISRRQVQICLKRLMNKRLIKRLIGESGAGSHSGYRYLMS